jgi:hypothetical protein
MAQRCVRDPIMRSLPGRCPSRPGAIDPRNTRPSDGSRSKGFGGRRAPRSCSVIPHTIPVRGAPVPLPRAGHTPASTAAISGASAVFRGFRPASLPTAATRDRRRLSLLATMRQEVLGMRGDPDVRQERLQVHLLRREAGGGLVRKPEIRRSRSRREACRTGLTTVLADRVARFGRIDRSHLGPISFGVVGPSYPGSIFTARCRSLYDRHPRLGPWPGASDPASSGPVAERPSGASRCRPAGATRRSPAAPPG